MDSTRVTPRKLDGVDHIAYVTWRPRATWEFYTDVMRMPLVHAITAKGWIVDTFPDFCHFFFDMGNRNHVAFFYFFDLPPDGPPSDLMRRSRHMAFHVDTEEELLAWRTWLKDHGVRVTHPTTHELIESIYFDDPNGIQLEITRPLRPFGPIDAKDAVRTLEALSVIESQPVASLEEMWRVKYDIIRKEEAGAG